MDPHLVIANPSSLDESSNPEVLTARESHITQLMTFIKSFLAGSSPLHVLLFGKAGTGKTAIARNMLAEIGEQLQAKTAYVNCWESPTFYSVADSLVKQLGVLFAERSETTHKLERIKKVLRKSRLVLVLDELDKAVPKERDNMLYQLLQMGNIALICVAGSRKFLMDLDQRVLSKFTPAHIE